MAMCTSSWQTALATSGRNQEAIAEFQQALSLKPDLASQAHCLMALSLMDLGRVQDAIEHLEQSLQIDATNAAACNNLAWFLATVEIEQLRDPARAVELAHKAHELKPQRTDFFNTIGVAHYRAGDYQDAIKWLDDSMQSSNGGNARDEFFLAMAHERLGNHSQAKEYYNQAVKWMEEYTPKDEELLRFRREAQELVSGKTAVNSEKRH